MQHKTGGDKVLAETRSDRLSTLIALHSEHGPLIGGRALVKALGYPSADAFRQAARRRKLPVNVFNVPNRRGRFALTEDVARWLSECAVEQQKRG